MKKFTKIMLIIAGSLAALGIVFSGIAAVMGAGWSTIHRKALAGELILATGILAMEFIMLMIRDMAAGIIFGMMIMMTMMIGTTKIGIMTTGMMRMTNSWMIIGRWRVLVPGS